MAFATPKDWTKESDGLYIHENGTRISKGTYQHREGWFLMSTDLDVPVLEFPATDAGREQAFAAFEKGLLKAPKKKTAAAETATAKRGRRKAITPPEEGTEEAEGGEGGEKDEDAEREEEDDED
jgi:hypothetical protein